MGVVTLQQVRLFVAVNFPVAAKEKISSLVGELQKMPSDVKWVKAANLHLTVQFLGNVDAGQTPAIVDALRRAVTGINSFQLMPGGAGVFPTAARPRVLWLGLSGETSVLIRLQRQVQAELGRIGFLPEKRRFSPHLTLGRVRSSGGFPELLEQMQKLAAHLQFSPVRIDSIELIRSELSPKGPSYFVLSRIPLAGPGPAGENKKPLL